MSAKATIIRFNTPGFESGAYEDGNGDRYVLTFSPCSSLSEVASCGSESSLQKMSVFSNVTDSQLRDQSGMPDVVGESMADGHVVKKPGDPGSVLVWDAVIKQFVSKLSLPEGVDYEPYELSDGDPLRRSQQDQGIREINYMLLSTDEVELASAKAIAGHWAFQRFLVPSDVTGDFRMSLYKDIGIELDETLKALDEEKGMDMSMPDFPLAFLNAEVGDETPEKPIPFGERGGDMQYLVDVFSTAFLDDTYDEVARYARRELRYPDYMIVRARALAGRSPGARPVRYGRDRAHRSRFVGESTRVGPKRAPVRSGYFQQAKAGSGTAAPVHVPLRMRPGPQVPRPTLLNFTPESGKAWLAGEKSRLLEGSNPGDLIAMNDAAAAISRGQFAGSRKALEDVLSKAKVYRWDREPTRNFQRGEGRLTINFSRQSGKKELTIAGFTIRSSEELATVEHAFRRNKPYYRAAQRYFKGELSGSEEARLRSALSAMSFVRHQGGAHSLQVSTDVPDAVKHLTGASVSVDVHHDFSFLPDVIEVATAAGVPLPKIRLAIQTTTMLLGVFTAPTAGAAALQAIQFIAGVDALWTRFGAKLAEIASPGLKLQGLVDFGSVIWEAILTSSAVMVVRAFFSEFWQTFIPSFEEMAAGLKKGLIIESAKSVAQSVAKYFSELIDRLKRCVKERSLSPLWGETWDPTAWENEVRNFVLYYPLLTTTDGVPEDLKKRLQSAHASGLPVWWNCSMHTKQYLEALDALILRGREIVAGLEKLKSSSQLVRATLENAVRFRDQLLNEVHGSGMRIAPLGVFLYGPAGTWKTNMADTLAKVIAEDNDLDTTSAGTYEWRKGVNFQDGLTHRQWHMKLDDVDQSVAPPTAGVQTHVEVVIDVINNTPLPVESAALEMKGKIRAAPLLVSYCTNYPHAQLRGRCLDPLPFFRRFPIRARVAVKPQYATPAGAVDQDKARAAGTHDLWDLHVSRYDTTHYDPSAPFSAAPYSVPVVMSFPAFCILMKKEFRKHIASQRELLGRKMRGDVDRCASCGLPTDLVCGCDGAKVAQPSEEAKAEVIDHAREFAGEEVVLQGRVSQILQLDAESDSDDDDSEPPFIVRRHSSFINCFRRLCNPRVFLAEVIDDLRERSREELARLGMEVVAKSALVIAVGGLIVKMVTSYGTTLQSRDPAVSWLGVPAAWQRPATDFSPGLPPLVPNPTFTKEALVASLRNHYVTVSCGNDACLGLLVSNGMVVYTKHVLPVGKVGKLQYGSVTVELAPTEVNSAVISGRELMVVRVVGLPAVHGAGHCFPAVDDATVTTFDEVELIYPDRVEKPDRQWVMSTNNGRALATTHLTAGGDCGVVYIGRIGGSWFARAIHYGLMDMLGSKNSVGEMLTQTALKTATARAGVIFQAARHIGSLFTKEETPFFAPLPLKSEARLAKSRGAALHVIGELHPRPFGSTPKTNVRPTIVADFFRDLEKEWCGEEGYWRPPIFRGAMINDQWWSPYQDNMLAFSRTRRAHLDCLLVAVCDYVAGVQYLDRFDYRHYSEQEVIVGNSAHFINPINAKTSTGPPYNTKKYHHYARVGDESAMSPEMAERVDAIKAVLKEGNIPIPFARAVLKDEVVKPGKAARLFTMLASAMNCTIAETMGLVFECMRRNPRFFESMVGIDMSGNGGDQLVEILASVDPSLDSIEEADVVKLDKCWAPELWDAVGLAFAFVAAALGGHYIEVESLVQGLKHTHYEVKGDVFEAPWNPSGQRGTVECNGAGMSISDRYVYYRNRLDLVEKLLPNALAARLALREGRVFSLDPAQFTYRSVRAMMSYGDDTLKNTKKGEVFSSLDQFEVLDSELGLKLTNGSKEKKVELLPLSKVSFLKRGIIFDVELGRYLCPITKKTIAKMLVAHAESTLSEADQAAIGMSNALREAALHGEEFYNSLLVRCRDVAQKVGLSTNPNFDAPDYSVRRTEMRNRTFTAWVSPVQLQSGELTSSTVMSVPSNILPPNSEELNAVPSVPATTTVGKIETGGEMLATPVEPLAEVLQKVPISDLDDFLTRFRLVKNFALPTTVTTSLPEVVQTCRPWSLWLADTQVKAKVQQFALIRGELEVLIKTAIGPGIAGAMEVTAIPDPLGIGNGAAVIMGTINPTNSGAVYPVNCRQTDIHATINYSAANDVTLDLPWVWPYDYLENPYSTSVSDQWIVNFVSLSPATTAVPSAVSGGNVAVYVRMKPGYTLTVPVMQGGVRKHLGNAISTLSEAGKGKKRGAISSVADTVADVTKKLEGIPIIGSYASMATSVVETAGNIAAFFGFSRTSVQPDSKAFYVRSLPNTVANDDSVPAEEQQLIPGIRLDKNPVLSCGTEEDPAALSSIFRRWTCYKIFSWAGSSASGTRLLHLDVTPGLAMLAGATGDGTHDNVRFFSTAGYVGLPFNWWRGDMEIMVEPFGTPFHRGTLQLAWVPFGSSWSAGDPTSAALNMIFDIEVGQRKVMRIPFARMEPYLRNLIYDMNVAILPSGSSNGTFFINVVNPLQGQTASPAIDVAVWIRGCENMDFRVPRDVITNRFLTTPATTAFNATVCLQGLGDEEKVITEEFSIGGSSGEFPTDEVCFPGNGFRSVRGLMQRLGKLCWNAATTNAAAHFLALPYGGVAPISSAVGTYANWIPVVTFQGWYGALFSTIAGGMRILVVMPTSGSISSMVSAGMYLNEGGLPLDGSQNAPWQMLGANGTSAEFHIPYSFAERFIAGQEFPDVIAGLQQIEIVNTGANATATVPTPQIYSAYSDDLRVGRFAQCPAVLFRVTPLTPGFTTYFK